MESTWNAAAAAAQPELYKLPLAPPERELARRVAIVTGTASGIGRAIARRLAAKGAPVVVLDRNGAACARPQGSEGMMPREDAMGRQRPNIVLINCHDLGRFLHCYGVPTVRTPHLDALAADGVLCTQAFCTAPQCSPARASLFAGRYPHSNGVMGQADGNFAWDFYPPGAAPRPGAARRGLRDRPRRHPPRVAARQS